MTHKLTSATIFLTLAFLAAPAVSLADADSLNAVLDKQSDDIKARYQYRRPAQTLEFFGIKPGMTVVEANPGGGWYTGILAPYLGSKGRLIGAAASVEFMLLAEYIDESQVDEANAWPTTWVARWEERGDGSGAALDAFMFDSLPESMHGTADAVVFFRALHGMTPVGENHSYLAGAFRDSYDVLKPGGIVGIVQHQAREDMPDDWATGENGYLKKSFIVDMMKQAGFELIADSDLNANPKDQPTTEDFVWRLPPSLDTSEDDPALRAQMQAIGESNRMTLRFQKPAD